MDTILRAFEAQIDSVLDGERAVVARINSSAVDRLRTVIDPLGADVSHFNKTRSVLWQHGQDPIRGTVPIGQGWAKVRRSERDILGKTSFAKDAFSDQLFEGYKDESIRGWSIKAGIHEASPPTKEEVRNRPELEDCDLIYRKWDLIELSATPTPGNSDCLTLLVSRGLITPPEGFVMPERTMTESLGGMATGGAAVRYITHSGNKWVVHAEDGKVLGEHGDEESAKKQLAAIEAHKHDKERWVDSDSLGFYVAEPTGERIVAFRTAADATECIRAMSDQRSFEQVLMNVHTEQRARFEQQKDDLLAEIQLRLWGVV